MTIEKIKELIDNKTLKICKKCYNVKEVSEFYLKKCKNNRQNRFHHICKKCHNIRPDGYITNYIRKLKFNISKEEYDLILKSQNNCCAICNKNRELFKRDFAIDHCHKSNKIRGLLCTRCNIGIGMLQEDLSIMDSAIKYILKYK